MSDSYPQAFEAPSVHELAPLFPGYEIETLIATGGMGAVYRAIQKSLDRAVAIKILPKEFSKDAAFCEGFEAEAKAMARLNHPNLIGVYDFGEVNGMLYIIMEYVPGQSLFHSSNGIAVDPAEVVRLVSGICDGLAHAHENGILHRDIKPSNILLDLENRPKIGDFGLARPMDRKIQEGEEIFGTPHYTAPEVVDAPHTVNNRADIFSVGVLLHELLTGKLPADDRRPASLISHCDPRFDSIIRRATNPLPEARYSNAAEISRELQSIGHSLGPRSVRGQAAPVNPVHRPVAGRRPARQVVVRKSSSGSSGVLVLVVVAMLAAVAYFLLSNKPAAPSNPPAPPAPTPAPEKTSPTKPGPTASDADDTETVPEIPADPVKDTAKHTPTENWSPKPKPADEPEANKPTAPEEAVLPKFDVPGFYARARKIMQDRAAPSITAHAESLKKNLTEFERGAKRVIRRMEYKFAQENAETALESFIEECQADNHRLPEKLGKALSEYRGIATVFSDSLDQQTAIDATLDQNLSNLTPIYITGLEKQIERLKADKDPGAVELIEEEVRNARSRPEYFPALMLGKDPDAVEEKEKRKGF
jgi:serine/threonine protein kinase